jgi:hypothetical protein
MGLDGQGSTERKGATPMANRITPTRNLTPVTDEQIQKVENLLVDLKKRATEALANKDVYMAGIYAELVKQVSPIVTRAVMRKDREEKANINREVRTLRKSATPFERASEKSE